MRTCGVSTTASWRVGSRTSGEAFTPRERGLFERKAHVRSAEESQPRPRGPAKHVGRPGAPRRKAKRTDASVVQWQDECLPSTRCGFDPRHSLWAVGPQLSANARTASCGTSGKGESRRDQSSAKQGTRLGTGRQRPISAVQPGCGAVGSARGWGPRGRGFEPRHPDGDVAKSG